VFWFVGLIPDLGTMRDKAKSLWTKRMFGILAMGWRGSVRHWKRYETAYLLLAGLATPLVLSVHTVVSFDFAVSILPGWHTTIFPPYFVAGAIYSGFAMVLVLAIPIRRFYGLKDMITMRHIDNSAKIMLATGLIVAYGYAMEAFYAFYSGDPFERAQSLNRWFGHYGGFYWALIACNLLIPQVLWIKKVRTNTILLFLVSLDVLWGMWLERFVIVIVSLSHDFLPSSWGVYLPTRWDYATFFGTIGFFFVSMFIFIRLMPMIPIFEVKSLLPESALKEEVAAHD
jgi:molybdopterin-containing oxidoreductase family membrane subunit